MFKYGLLIMPFTGKQTVRTGGVSPVRAYSYQSIGLHYVVEICLLRDGGLAHPLLHLGFRPGNNSIALYSKKMSCMYFILRIAEQKRRYLL